MAQKILGLDIGSHSIKAALFETAYRTYALTDLFQSPPLNLDDNHPEEHPVIIAEFILQMIHKNGLKASNTVSALSGKLVSNRILKLPLPPKQIGKILPFEIESNIPFPLEDLIIDHHVIESSRHETICLAAVAQKTVIQEHLGLLHRAGIEPSFITFDAVSLYNLNQFIPNESFKTYAIVDIGHQKTSVCVVSNQKIALIRTLYTGGHDIDVAIQSEMNLTLEQAAEVKEKHGILDVDRQPVRTQDLKKLSTCIKTVINPLFQEIFQSFHLFRTQDWIPSDDQKIQNVFFCGGTSLLKNLPEYFTSLFNIPSQRMYLLDHQSPDRPSRAKEPIFASAVGIGMKVAARGKSAALVESINFRKEGFSFSKSLGDFQDQIFFYGKWVLVIFALAFVQLILKNTALRHENSGIEKVVLQEYKKIIPGDKTTSAKNAIKKLETKIQELQQKQDVLTAGLNKMTALGVLRELSVLIPPDILVDLEELSIERNKITVKGKTDSFASVDRVIASVQSYKDFERVEKGDIRETTDGKKGFQMTILVGEAGKEKDSK